MSIVVAYYHAVISTRYRRMTIDERYKGELYAYLSGILKNRSCTPLVINGVGDHIHLLFGLNPQVALSDLMRDLKRGSSLWLKREKSKFPLFEGWGKEYAAFGVNYARKHQVADYILNQEAHHHAETFDHELQRFVLAHELPYRAYQPADDD